MDQVPLTFRDWLALNEAASPLPTVKPQVPKPHFNYQLPSPTKQHRRAKRAAKDNIMSYWQALRPNTPIVIDPIPASHRGSTYAQDGLRITGSRQFIDGILSRLKDLMAYENQSSKLDLVYRPIDTSNRPPESQRPGAYVFYLMAQERGGKIGRPKGFPA